MSTENSRGKSDLEQLRGILGQFSKEVIAEAISEMSLRTGRSMTGRRNSEVGLRLGADSVESILKRLEIPEIHANQIRSELKKNEGIQGFVSRIIAFKDKDRKYVEGIDGSVESFEFPPNDEKFDEWLKWAWENKQPVIVVFRFDWDTGQNIIEFIEIGGPIGPI